MPNTLLPGQLNRISTVTPASGDLVVYYDVSADALGKATLTDLMDAAGTQASQTITTLSTSTIQGASDSDTTIVFGDDSIVGSAGGVEFVRAVESTQDAITFNNGAVDIDFTVKKLTSGNVIAYDAGADTLALGAATNTINGDVTFADGTTDVDVASHDGTNGLKLGGVLVTATAAELNIMDGVTASTADINATTNFEETISATTSEVTILTGKTLNVADDGGLKINETAVTSTAAELNILDGATITVSELNTLDASAGNPGTVGTPASGTITLSTERVGNMYISTFTLTAAQIPVTDGAGSGSYGSLKLLDFPEGYIRILGSSQVYTAFAEGAALTGGAGDAVFEIGLGTTAISAAADGTLGATEDNIGTDVNITLSGGTGTGKDGTATDIMHDGTTTALDLNLNWSGTAATIDANSTIDVTGTIRVMWVFFGDAA